VIAAVLPVKSPADSMRRLSGLLSHVEREELVRKLFHQALDSLSAVSELDLLIVVATEPSFIDAARCAGAGVLVETVQLGHSHSAERGVEMAIGLGAETLLAAPIDVPLATAADYEALLGASRRIPSPGLLIVPSSDGTGTNALVRKPPDVIPSQFGVSSFERHLSSGQAAGATVQVLHPPGITLDLDTPEDLLEIERQAGSGNSVLDYLGNIDAFGRARTAAATPLL
jgi:2-phospho-L-lactate guanylyltransferase